MKDYYKILNVSSRASQKEIHMAYRKAVKKYHPDVSSTGSHEKFLEVKEAYEILGDPGRRKDYDDSRKGPHQVREGGRSPLKKGYSSFDRVIKAEIILTSDEAYRGGFFTISVPFNMLCPSCSGRWWLSWSCWLCQGNGETTCFVPITVKVPPRTIPGTVILKEFVDPWGKAVYLEFSCKVHTLY